MTIRKFIEQRPFADPKAAARKLMEIANSIEPVQDGRIHIELINGPFLYELRGSPAEYKAALDFAIERGWLWKHESGTYVKFTQAGDEVQLYAFDILALDGDDLQALPLSVRKVHLSRLLARRPDGIFLNDFE